MSSPSEAAPLLPGANGADRNVRTWRSTVEPGLLWRIGAVYGALGVALGAFGAHGLKKSVSDPAKLASWATAAHYQLVHSGILLVASQSHPLASIFFITGVTFFSGSIYALILDPAHFKCLGPVTPIGGMFLIFGWIALAFPLKWRS